MYVSCTRYKFHFRPENAKRPPSPPDISMYVLRMYIVALASIGDNGIKYASHCVS